METSQSTASGGLWNNPRVTQCSKEAQDMMRVIKEESRLTNLQRKPINKRPKNGEALPLTSDPTASSPLCLSIPRCLPGHSQKRSAESCQARNSDMREKFRPGPIRDLEKEKRRLQSILATGKEEPTPASSQKAPACSNPEESKEIDWRQQVLNEIEERREFLADMASLGQAQHYVSFISTEISQKMRELELLEKASSTK